jgi:uncharacterized membrane protein
VKFETVGNKMNRYVQLALLLLVPLALIAAVALSVYGLQGPSDNDKNANTIGCLVGAGYGVYAVCVITWFIKKGRHQ